MADHQYNNNKCKEGQHLLQLKSTSDDKHISNSFECDGCKQPGFGFRYCCCNCGKHQLHEECYRANSVTIPNPNFHRHLSASSSKSQSRFCNACGKQILGFFYHSESEGASGLYLHPCCNNLDHNITSANMEFTLHQVVGGIKSQIKDCFHCWKPTLSGPGTVDKEVPGWSYVSTCEPHDWCHVYCMRELMMQIRESELLLIEKKEKQKFVRKWLSVANIATGLLLKTMTGS